MSQDDLEEEILLQSMYSQMQVVVGMVQSITNQSNISISNAFLIIIVTSIIIILSILWFFKYNKVAKWFGQIFSLDGARSPSDVTEWTESIWNSSVFSMQGKRDNNEDRAVMETIKMVEGVPGDKHKEVHLWAVMDGHGGQFCADYGVKHLIPSIKLTIQKLKLLTSSIESKDKLKLYEKHFKSAPRSVLKYLQISDSEYDTLKCQNNQSNTVKRDSSKDESDCNETSEDKTDNNEEIEDTKSASLMSRCQLVMSPRTKSLEELPSINKKSEKKDDQGNKTPKFKSRSKNKMFSSDKNLLNKKRSRSKSTEEDITEFIKDGEIIYSKLIKKEISKFDTHLLEAAKKANNIGGTTLIMAIQDSGHVWVANVGDSRAVFSNDNGMAIPMSYDHKPCQLKEKKRIQEAGGFVAMNGVWRVMGVLATSRALGDYPLKDKKVVVCDPDILSFNIKDHRMQFAILASDGLWDTHTNEDAVTVIGTRIKRDSDLGTEVLAREAFNRGSLDNITVLVIDFTKFGKN